MHAPVLCEGLDARVAHVPIHVTAVLPALGNTARRDEGLAHNTPRSCVSSDATFSRVGQRRGPRQARGAQSPPLVGRVAGRGGVRCSRRININRPRAWRPRQA